MRREPGGSRSGRRDPALRPCDGNVKHAGAEPATLTTRTTMFSANTYVIRMATDDDARALRGLGEIDSQAPVAGRALIGEIDGTPVAALSLGDGRVTANPFRRTEHLVACLRMRAQALNAYEATPSLRDRILAALPARYRAGFVTASATA
jgi:hypothetical protein